ncbi:hypothetical protein FRC01_004088 [Tulasnella sp. 417]|nr:hypothetical protein FRC01_004088 [Tulasnella sp. 417]
MKLLEYWFPASRGWNVAQEPRLANGTRPDFLVSIRTNEAGQPTTGWVDAEGTRTVVVVETKRPSNHWTDAGRANIMNEVEEYMEHEIDQHELNVIWGITMIGYHWKGVKRAEPGEGLENCTEWADDIMSPESWAQMRAFKNQITGEVMPA